MGKRSTAYFGRVSTWAALQTVLLSTKFSCACLPILPMPRRPTYLKKSAKLQVEKLVRKCQYCMTHRNARGFDKHVAWCKKTWKIREELRASRTPTSTPTRKQFQAEGMPPILPQIPTSLLESRVNDEFVEGPSSMPMEVGYASPEQGDQEHTMAPSLYGTLVHFPDVSL